QRGNGSRRGKRPDDRCRVAGRSWEWFAARGRVLEDKESTPAFRAWRRGPVLSWWLRGAAKTKAASTFRSRARPSHEPAGPRKYARAIRSEERRVGKECRCRWSPKA